MPPFGRLRGDVKNAWIEKTLLGSIVENNILRLPLLSPSLEVMRYVVMPDHIHFLLFVTDTIQKPIGSYIGMMKVKTGQDFRAAGGCDGPVFEKDFYDCILHRKRSLATIVDYIRSNPRRLAVRRERPDFFRRVNGLEIDGRRYSAYGNFYLLRNPFREQVVVHRRDTEAERAANRERWLHTAANGGVLVSPFISPAEKAIRTEAEALGSKIILITDRPMPERYKPAARDFDLCTAGRLLIISAAIEAAPLSRDSCLTMNTLAASIVK